MQSLEERNDVLVNSNLCLQMELTGLEALLRHSLMWMNFFCFYSVALANVKVATYTILGPFHSQLFKHTEHDILKQMTLSNGCSCRFVAQTAFKLTQTILPYRLYLHTITNECLCVNDWHSTKVAFTKQWV